MGERSGSPGHDAPFHSSQAQTINPVRPLPPRQCTAITVSGARRVISSHSRQKATIASSVGTLWSSTAMRHTLPWKNSIG